MSLSNDSPECAVYRAFGLKGKHCSLVRYYHMNRLAVARHCHAVRRGKAHVGVPRADPVRRAQQQLQVAIEREQMLRMRLNMAAA